jgi:hypothetical protein
MNTISTATGYLIGLDLGERVDYTALSVLRQHAVPTGRLSRQYAGFTLEEGRAYGLQPEAEYQYDLTYLDRWRGQGYKVAVPIVAQLIEELHQDTHRQRMAINILNQPALPVWVLVDHTGVGIAVLEDLRAAGLDCTGITITSGDTVNRRGWDYLVPKIDLVSTLKVLVENRRLHGSAELPLWSTLEAEMQNFKVKKTLSTGHDTYGAGTEWREGAHDDLVLSVAMAAWFGEAQDPVGNQRSWEAIFAAYRQQFSEPGL